MDTTAVQFGWNPAFLGGLSSIILINIILSGDNSIVIALAVRTLPRAKRNLGLFFGAGAAAILRILFTVIAARLMHIPYLKLAGGLLILWIAIKLLSENENPDPAQRQARGLLHAMWIILVADLTMSLDNVLAVAGASKDNLLLLWLGLGLSIPIVIFASGLLSGLMERFPIIVILGAMVLGKVGGEMIAGDPALHEYFTVVPHINLIGQILGMGMILLISFRIKKRRSKTPRIESPED